VINLPRVGAPIKTAAELGSQRRFGSGKDSRLPGRKGRGINPVRIAKFVKANCLKRASVRLVLLLPVDFIFSDDSGSAAVRKN
jgi:hypothetical protein